MWSLIRKVSLSASLAGFLKALHMHTIVKKKLKNQPK